MDLAEGALVVLPAPPSGTPGPSSGERRVGGSPDHVAFPPTHTPLVGEREEGSPLDPLAG